MLFAPEIQDETREAPKNKELINYIFNKDRSDYETALAESLKCQDLDAGNERFLQASTKLEIAQKNSFLRSKIPQNISTHQNLHRWVIFVSLEEYSHHGIQTKLLTNNIGLQTQSRLLTIRRVEMY